MEKIQFFSDFKAPGSGSGIRISNADPWQSGKTDIFLAFA